MPDIVEVMRFLASGQDDPHSVALTGAASEIERLRAALNAAQPAVQAWLPIESAPKDGTCIDLWMVDQDGRGWREAGAYWTNNDWWEPNHDYDGGDGPCTQERTTFKNGSVHWSLPTHWQPLPAPPET